MLASSPKGKLLENINMKNKPDYKYKIGDTVLWNYCGRSGVSTILGYAPSEDYKYYIVGPPQDKKSSDKYHIREAIDDSGKPITIPHGWNVEEDFMQLQTCNTGDIKLFQDLKYKIGDQVLYNGEIHTIVAYYKRQNVGYTISGPKGYHQAEEYSFDALGNKAILKDWTHIYVTEDQVSPLTSTPTESSLKVGDKVRVKSLDWYNANKDSAGKVPVQYGFVPDMCKYCGKEGTITSMDGDLLHISFQNYESMWRWSREMLDLGSSSVIKCKTKTQKPAIHNIYTPNQTILKTKKHVNSKIVH